MDFLTEHERAAVQRSAKLSSASRRKAVLNVKRKATKALEDLAFLAESEGLPNRVKREIFTADAMEKLVSSIITLKVNRQTQRLPPDSGRKWPLQPGWIQSTGYPVLRGRWIRIGGVLRDQARAPLRKDEQLWWAEVAYRMLRSMHARLSQTSILKGEGLAAWLSKDGATLRLRVSRHRLHTREVRGYDFQRTEPLKTEERVIVLPIGNDDPTSISLIVLEDKRAPTKQ